MQLLKLSIDYNAASWFDYDNQPFIAYIDLSYYIGLLSANDTSSLMVFFMIAMSIYWIIPFTLKIYGFDRGDTFNNIYKIIYFVVKNIVLLPLFNVFLKYSTAYLVYLIAIDQKNHLGNANNTIQSHISSPIQLYLSYSYFF